MKQATEAQEHASVKQYCKALRVPVISYADTAATVAIPQLAPLGATQLVVSVGSASSNALAFEVLP